MTIYLISIRGKLTGRYKVRAETPDGALVGQALHASEPEAEKRAKRQAYRMADDRNWGRLRFVRKPAGATP